MSNDPNWVHNMAEVLRAEGCAVICLGPDELKLPDGSTIDRQELEQVMRMASQQHIANLSDSSFEALVTRHAENGKVCVVWSGRDCDGVQYSGEVRIMQASPGVVKENIDHYLEWADGPCSWAIVKPSEAAKIAHEVRDLTLEAFENGRTFNITPEN